MIVTAVGTPLLVLTVWCLPAAWLAALAVAVAVIAIVAMILRRAAEPFQLLRDQLLRDEEAIREVAQ